MASRTAKGGLIESVGGFLFGKDDDNLAELSLESVVARFQEKESKRPAKYDSEASEAEAARVVFVQHSPVELLSSLRAVATSLGVSRSLLTKCLSHQLIDWYNTSLGMSRLEVEYQDIYSRIQKRCYTTLRIQAENPAAFAFSSLEPLRRPTSLTTIGWAWSRLSEIRDVTGVNATDLLLVGLVFCLTTSEGKQDDHTIRTCFLPERHSMEMLVRDRIIDVEALRKKYELRERFRAEMEDRNTGKDGDNKYSEKKVDG